MRLTQTMRDDFVRRAMSDVPRTDYEQQAREVMVAYAESKLPPKVVAVYKDPTLREFVNKRSVYEAGFGAVVPCGKDFKLDAATKAAVAVIEKASDAQEANRSTLKGRLRAVTLACTTRKALAEALPEFARYLPSDEAPDRQLPVVADVVSIFTKAGWPKGKEPVAASKKPARRKAA